jgi:hypothetical protein
LQTATAVLYRSYSSNSRAVYDTNQIAPSPQKVERGFINDFFESEREYNKFSNEFDNSTPVRKYQKYENISNAEEAVYDNYEEPYEQHEAKYWAGIKMLEGRATYSLIRKLKPSTLVETGVANGWSTMCILSALRKNSKGSLYSIDYQLKSDKEFEKYKQEHFFGDAKIPANKDTGWLIPEELRHRWELRLGRSQRILPKLMTDLGEIDYFQHDSEHSDPCMMFEYEMAWEFLTEDGILISDDMNPSVAWEIFSDTRSPSSAGLIAYPNQGYLLK